MTQLTIFDALRQGNKIEGYSLEKADKIASAMRSLTEEKDTEQKRQKLADLGRQWDLHVALGGRCFATRARLCRELDIKSAPITLGEALAVCDHIADESRSPTNWYGAFELFDAPTIARVIALLFSKAIPADENTRVTACCVIATLPMGGAAEWRRCLRARALVARREERAEAQELAGASARISAALETTHPMGQWL